MAKTFLEDQNPDAPMFMLVYRHCMVYGKSPDPGYLEELDLKTIDEFKNDPVDEDKYQLLKSYMKAYILDTIDYVFKEALTRKKIDKEEYDYLWTEMNNYLKEINPKAQSLVKVKQSQPNIENYLDIISKECFDNSLQYNCKKSVKWYLGKIGNAALTPLQLSLQ